MKKFLFLLALVSLAVPVLAADEASVTPGVASVKYYTRPDMSRFQYGLPEPGDFHLRKKKNKDTAADSLDVITLDEDDIKPVKKVIKRVQPSANPQQFDPQDVKNSPMNYDNFPKFYNPNDLMNQQFIPTATF